ncbi:alpha/beta fold hydrolase [Amnibacterium setariae]|uniref:Alpha/beta hydrolase n=1 Tax=Amnibacterium setariae TaxID=2306585 RepID=A0A3A1TVE1_9MICO|nr:alpha/beta hydrolase [Amnibacterium setariae]RIX27790.1 alpha/beta hydrolase [Amnibacterium setariae]
MAGAVEPVEVGTPAGPVAVHVLGAGLPTVLWHGLYADGSSWGYLLPALLPGRRLLVVDGPGWGRSLRTRRSVGDAAVLDAARAVVRTLAPGSAVDWVGTGWGGRVGLELAARSPELVRSLVAAMADPAPMPAEERRAVRRVLRRLRVVGPIGPVGRAIVVDQLSPASASEPQTVGALLDALLLAGRFRAARSVGRFDVRRPDLTGLLPAVTAPLLLVASDDAGPLPEARAASLAALAPFARVTTVPEARGQLALDRPEAFGRAVQDFWTGLAVPD